MLSRKRINIKLASATNCNDGTCLHRSPTVLQEFDICFHFIEEFKRHLQVAFDRRNGPTNNIPNPFVALQYVREALFGAPGSNSGEYMIIWEDSILRKRVKSLLLSLGTNYLLTEKRRERVMSITVAFLILWLDTDNDKHMLPCLLTKDLLDDNLRETVRFYHKRLKCDCLKSKWLQLKTEPKQSKCHHCKRKIQRREVLLCGACRRTQYCSKACQRGDWPAHSNRCGRGSQEIEPCLDFF